MAYVPVRPATYESFMSDMNHTGRLALVLDALVYIANNGGGGGGGPVAVTPAVLAAYSIALGGTAQNVVVGPCNGGWIENPLIATENMYVDMVAAAQGTDAAAAGSSTTVLAPGQSFTIPKLALGSNVSVNAATTGHKFSGEQW